MAIIAEIEAGVDGSKIKKTDADNLKFNGNTSFYMVVPERKKAIETAINAAQRGDIILIAGKGHEDYQIMGTQKLPFDDRVVVREILKSRSQ
jgi:UDP-N-acetylmuramoyl-L-alanyl-D-glutamate--2,6-diaminopimelate ligase